MEYALESSANVQDEILQRELSHTSDEKMKSIISTIQKEQNRIIRNEKAETLVIQGVAGSGKTSIALHRICLLYTSFRGIRCSWWIMAFCTAVFDSTFVPGGWFPDGVFEAILRGQQNTVSYTHLDVYKRQVFEQKYSNRIPVLFCLQFFPLDTWLGGNHGKIRNNHEEKYR